MLADMAADMEIHMEVDKVADMEKKKKGACKEEEEKGVPNLVREACKKEEEENLLNLVRELVNFFYWSHAGASVSLATQYI